MGNSRDGSRGGLSVGGPGGIHIEGNNVQIGGTPMVGLAPVQAPPAVPPAQTPQPMQVSADLSGAPAMLARYSGVVGAGLSVGAGLLVLGAAVVISVVQLPWLLLAVPGAFGAVMLTAGMAVMVRARKRITTGGIDPEMERRIIDVAMACQGRVTVTAVARALSIPMAEADATLTSLSRSGHITVDNDPTSGVVVYVFPDIEAGLVPVRRSP